MDLMFIVLLLTAFFCDRDRPHFQTVDGRVSADCMFVARQGFRSSTLAGQSGLIYVCGVNWDALK